MFYFFRRSYQLLSSSSSSCCCCLKSCSISLTYNAFQMMHFFSYYFIYWDVFTFFSSLFFPHRLLLQHPLFLLPFFSLCIAVQCTWYIFDFYQPYKLYQRWMYCAIVITLNCDSTFRQLLKQNGGFNDKSQLIFFYFISYLTLTSLILWDLFFTLATDGQILSILLYSLFSKLEFLISQFLAVDLNWWRKNSIQKWVAAALASKWY